MIWGVLNDGVAIAIGGAWHGGSWNGGSMELEMTALVGFWWTLGFPARPDIQVSGCRAALQTFRGLLVAHPWDPPNH